MTPPYLTLTALAALAAGTLPLLDAHEEPQCAAGGINDHAVYIQTNTRIDGPTQELKEHGLDRQAGPQLGRPHRRPTRDECAESLASGARVEMDAPLMVGQLSFRPRCGRGGLGLLQGSALGQILLGPPCVVYAYLAVCSLVVLSIFYSLLRSYPKEKLLCPEDSAWNYGVLHWLWMGWATQWVMVWGNSNNMCSKVGAEEMPISLPEDDCALCFLHIQRLWDEEVAKLGLEKASIMPMLMRFIRYRKVLVLGVWCACYDGFLFLGPPLAIEWATNYLRMLYTQRALGHQIPEREKVAPTIMIILVFTGLPMLMIICNTVSTMLGSRMAIRISGGMSCLIFAKGQRLPIAPSSEDEPEGNAAGFLANTEKEPKGDEDAEEKEQRALKPKKFNLVQLVGQDVNINVMSIPLCLIKVAVMIPVFACLLALLIKRLHLAIVFTLGAAFINVSILAPVGYKMKVALAQFYKSTGERLQFFQQVITSIRFVKSSGCEVAVQRRLELARAGELNWLNWYYNYLCLMIITVTQFPKLYLLASLGGFCLLNGNPEPTTIWSLATLLLSIQGSIAAVFQIIPTLVGALPSFGRLEAFLKLPEAPRASSLCSFDRNTELEPPWVSTWTSPGGEAEGPDRPSCALRVTGTFSWQPGGPPALRDLRVAVPRGSTVAVVGHMGAGKTTLLSIILGELYPQGEACIEVSRRIAYAAQVPHLFEGTLKDNILQGEQWDSERYEEVIRATCLQPDLRMLPGGDEAPVGSRGITLSGGQKTRVSMARAAYCMTAEIVLIDDPYGAVDACTANHLDENLLNGTILKNRTCIVVCQPDSERLARFDRVLVLSEGRVVVSDRPQEALCTEEYRKLLRSQPDDTWELESQQSSESQDSRKEGCGPGACAAPGAQGRDHQSVFKLRDEEFEGRASWSTFTYFLQMGGSHLVPCCIAFYALKHGCEMAAQMMLARWTTHGMTQSTVAGSSVPDAKNYLAGYLVWVLLGTTAHVSSWYCGQWCQLRCSKLCHAAVTKSLLRAPTDGFFDKNPVGRIMNRMANDMMNMDQKVFMGLCSAMGVVVAVTVDLCYVHTMMPFWFTCLCFPVYCIMVSLLRLYWRTMIPLRYLLSTLRSTAADHILNVEVNNASTRAYGKSDHALALFQDALRKQITADFVGKTILMRWLCNRLFLLGGFFVTCIAIVVVWVPDSLDIGRASLCVMTLFQLTVAVESYVVIGISAQYQIIAMNRLYEYTALPEERDEELPTDKTYMNFIIHVPRVDLGWLHSEEDDGGLLQVVRTSPTGPQTPVLRQAPGRAAFQPMPDRTLLDLAADCTALRGAEPWHRLAGVNSAHGTADVIAEELCTGTSKDVTLYIESGWLADGVKLEIQKLRVGYAGVARDVLRSVNLTVPRKCRMAIVGKTGCGKSTLLLSILRILEPRAGRICLEGVDTQIVGLRTLRSAIGMVPQEPLLLQGPLRYNLDPMGQYDDERIWDALSIVHLADFVRGLEGGLNYRIREEGANLSFGQRQLMNLARNVLRRPMLILLDEATSALDPHLNELLHVTIRKAFPDSSMMVVAHRLEAILDFDMVVVMHEGKVVEQGCVKGLSQITDGILAKMLHAAQLL